MVHASPEPVYEQDFVMTEQSMNLEPWEIGAPAQLQYWPVHAHPTGPGAWDHPRPFSTLRDAIAAAITEAAPQSQVAWILTSGGRTLEPGDIEDLWLQLRASA